MSILRGTLALSRISIGSMAALAKCASLAIEARFLVPILAAGPLAGAGSVSVKSCASTAVNGGDRYSRELRFYCRVSQISYSQRL